MCAILNKHVSQLMVSPAVKKQCEIEVPVSCYDSGMLSSTLVNEMHSEELLIRVFFSHSRNLTIETSMTLYCHKNGKHDTAMIHKGE